MELAHTDVLTLIAEVSATFVGFSLAIGLLQANQPGAKLRKQAMHSVAELAMISCAGALVVLVVQTFGLSAETTWRVGSGCAALFWGATFSWAIVRYAEAGHSLLKDRRVTYPAAMSVVGIGLFVMNVAVPTETIGAIHIAGLFLALVTAGYLFLLSTFLIDTDENAA
jgi:hypothetical protein